MTALVVPETVEQWRFWEKVALVGAEPGDCWEWKAARNPSGHGRFSLTHRHQVPAHRYAYEHLVGPISDGLHLDHLCRNPGCVNPEHLEPVSLWENLSRAPNQLAMINRQKTHCPAGHPYDAINTCLSRGHRSCRTCGREKARDRRKAERRRT